MPDRITILDVPFDRTTLKQALERVDEVCKGSKQEFWVTPNPEICLEAQKNAAFRKTLNEADFSIPDGFGILWAARYLEGKRGFFSWLWTLLTPHVTKHKGVFPERVTGTDLMAETCRLHPKRKVFLLGARSEVNDQLTQQLKNQGVAVVGNYAGDASKKLEPIIQKMINASEAELLFVAFGAPKQELWIQRNLPNLKTVKLAVGIGGAFDFLTGERKRAPKWMRSIGIEWLFRVIIEPSRIKRIFRATVIFPWKVWRKSVH